jgi:hypothetical protein
MNQKAALAVGALAGAALAFVLGRRRISPPQARPEPTPAPADDLQARLAEAREARIDEAEFDAAGMAGETIVAEESARRPPPPADEFEAMRRRVHEEARAAAEEMRRKAESSD